MEDKTPEISICVPTFNGAKFIAETINSILSQTFQNFEIIISDDGSTDQTLEIIRRISDTRISRIDTLAKVGAEANWNNSIANAQGQLIKIVCQDDLLYPKCLETEVAAMSQPENSDAAFCFHLRDYVTPNTRTIKGRRVGNAGRSKYSGDELFKKIVRSGGNPIGEPMAVTMRASALKKAGSFRGDYVIDLDMWARLAEHGNALFIDQRLSAFRISKTSWTSNLTKSHRSSVLHLSQRIRSQNLGAVSFTDELRGRILSLVRATVRQLAQRVILLVDGLLGATSKPSTENHDQHSDTR